MGATGCGVCLAQLTLTRSPVAPDDDEVQVRLAPII